MPTTVYIQGMRQTRDKLGRFAAAIDAEAIAVLNEGAELALKVMQSEAPIDLGAGVQDMHIEPIDLSAGPVKSIAVVSPHDYMTVQNYGRRAGARQPPYQALIGWAGRHNNPSYGHTDEEFAYLAARSIGRYGFPGKHFFEKAQAEANIFLKKRLVIAGAFISKVWGG